MERIEYIRTIGFWMVVFVLVIFTYQLGQWNAHMITDQIKTYCNNQTLYNIGIFKTIKTAINYGVEGFFFSAIEIEHTLEVNKLINCLKKLPKPYNLYVCDENQEHIVDKSGIVRFNTTSVNISLSIELY